jgi:xanthine/uracil/vitamin C permease (AzgA family)
MLKFALRATLGAFVAFAGLVTVGVVTELKKRKAADAQPVKE